MSTFIIFAWIITGIILSTSVAFFIMLRAYNKIQGNNRIDVTRIVNYLIWLFKEFINTLSSKKSHFSSKRIERLILFVSGVSIMDCYVYTHRIEMTAETMLMVVGAQMVWAGFNTTQLTTDRKIENSHKTADKPADVNSEDTLA